MQKSFCWAYLASSYICIIILASGEDVRNDYKRAWTLLRLTLSRREDPSQSRAVNFMAPDGSCSSADTMLDEIPIIVIGHDYGMGKTHLSDAVADP